MYSKEVLMKLFSSVPEDQMRLIEDDIDEYLYFCEELRRLQKLPLIVVDKKNPEHQKITPAGKQIHKVSNIVDAKRALLIRVLIKNGSSEADELEGEFKQFE